MPLNVKAQNPERFVCERVDPETDRPALPPHVQIDWDSLLTVEEAKEAFDTYVIRERERNQVVGAYVRHLEGVNFVCWNNMEWQNNYYDNLETLESED